MIGLDITNQRSGNLVALYPVEREDKRHKYWLCKCDCGNTSFVASTNFKETYSCGCRGNGIIYTVASKAEKKIFSDYKNRANHDGMEFSLPFLVFRTAILSSCFYCGSSPSNGIDRIDSSKGYTIENIVPCCSTCNHAKMDMNFDDFICWIMTISKFNRVDMREYVNDW